MSNSFRINMEAPNLVSVCVDARSSQGSSGRMYCRCRREALYFDNEYQLLKLMEELMDRIGYPQASVEMRSYRKERPKPEGKPKLVQSSEEVASCRGTCATFLIHVRYRQNATWQGEICWAERARTLTFRSALELLKLIDSARE